MSTTITTPNSFNTVHKYALEVVDEQRIHIPVKHEPLHVGLDPHGNLCLWCAVDSTAVKEAVEVCVVGTGNPLPSCLSRYSSKVVRHVGSAAQGMCFWHVFIR